MNIQYLNTISKNVTVFFLSTEIKIILFYVGSDRMSILRHVVIIRASHPITANIDIICRTTWAISQHMVLIWFSFYMCIICISNHMSIICGRSSDTHMNTHMWRFLLYTVNTDCCSKCFLTI